MEELVDEDARKLGGGAVEGDAALTKESGGVDGAATVPQARNELQENGASTKFGQGGSNGSRSRAEERVGREEQWRGHRTAG